MADNNDEQYLDELLNSLRTSNDDGSEALNDDKDNKDKPSEDAVENNSAVNENTAAQENVDSADKPQENDDIFALEENESEAVQPPSEDDSKEDSADEDVEDDSLMKLFNQINGDSAEEHNDAEDTQSEEPSSNVQEESASDESADNPPDDILTITDDLDETQDDGSQEQDVQENDAPEQNAENDIENVEQEKSEPVDMKKDEESEKPMSSKEAKAEAARAAKEAKAAAAKAAKEAKAAEKERKKAEKKAKKEQKKAERAAKKNKKQEEEPSEQPVVDAATQENADLINGLFDDSPAFGGASDDDLDSIPEREPEKPKKEKKKKEKKKKEPKPKKPKAPKVKKEKRPPLPSELVKVTPGTFIGMIVTIVVIVGTVYVGTNLVSYNITVNQAKEHFYNGKFDQAFDAISGINVKDSDKDTYYGIRAVASVYVDYTSYINYKKVGMTFEALDSLIKGLLHYDEYYSEAEKYDVLVQYNDVKQIILTELSKYGISEDDAIRYSNLESEQQYKEILSDIGGVTE